MPPTAAPFATEQTVPERPCRMDASSKGATAMLIIFKSAASGDVITFEKNARQILEVLGKDRHDGKGIVTVEQLPDAIARLRQAIAEDLATYAPPPDDTPQSTSPEGEGVSFHQRATPMLELLERSLGEGVPVTWGV